MAAGSLPNKRPADWLRFQGREFVEHAEKVCGTHLFEISTGRGGETWGYKDIALGYATDLNPGLRTISDRFDG